MVLLVSTAVVDILGAGQEFVNKNSGLFVFPRLSRLDKQSNPRRTGNGDHDQCRFVYGNYRVLFTPFLLTSGQFQYFNTRSIQ